MQINGITHLQILYFSLPSNFAELIATNKIHDVALIRSDPNGNYSSHKLIYWLNPLFIELQIS